MTRRTRWGAYDNLVRAAGEQKIKVLFSIWGTPGWANKKQGLNYAPTLSRDLRNFAYAAAKRYSGTFVPDDGNPDTVDETLPAVRLWLVWNEPGNPIFLKPQYKRVGTGKKRHWVAQSPIDYARMCAAVYTGVHATLLRNEKVGCGATGPRGNNNPCSQARLDRPAPLPARRQEGRAEEVRRLGAPPVLREPQRDTRARSRPRTAASAAASRRRSCSGTSTS